MPTEHPPRTPPDVALAFLLFLICCFIACLQSELPVVDTLRAWLNS